MSISFDTGSEHIKINNVVLEVMKSEKSVGHNGVLIVLHKSNKKYILWQDYEGNINSVWIEISRENIKKIVVNCERGADPMNKGVFTVSILVDTNDTTNNKTILQYKFVFEDMANLNLFIRTMHRFCWLVKKSEDNDGMIRIYTVSDSYSQAILDKVTKNRVKIQNPIKSVLDTMASASSMVKREIGNFFDGSGTKKSFENIFFDHLSNQNNYTVGVNSYLTEKNKLINDYNYRFMFHTKEESDEFDKFHYECTRNAELMYDVEKRRGFWLETCKFNYEDGDIQDLDQQTNFDKSKSVVEKRHFLYEIFKSQYRGFLRMQLNKFSDYTLRRNAVEKDTSRADKHTEFYKGADNENCAKLYEILMCHVMYNFDLGYVQGMADLLSPILKLFEGDCVKAFWVFTKVLKRAESRFDFDQIHMLNCLKLLRDIVEFLWPDFFNYLKKLNSEDMFFAFPWLLLSFKRMFKYTDVYTLWEIIWAQKLCKDNYYEIFLAVALIASEKDYILANDLSAEKLLLHFNQMADNISVKKLVIETNRFVAKLKETPYMLKQISSLLVLKKDDFGCCNFLKKAAYDNLNEQFVNNVYSRLYENKR